MRIERLLCAALLFFLSISSECGWAQNSGQPGSFPVPQTMPVPGQMPPNGPGVEDAEQRRIQREMAKKENQERQTQLKRDTDNLLKLATELKQSVDKTNANTLSIEVIKKAEEIEKLAHSVKEKMKAN